MNFFGSKNDMEEWVKSQSINNDTIFLLDLQKAFEVATCIFKL